MKKTIIVSNRLPLKIEGQGEDYKLTPSEGGLATGLGDIYKKGNNVWIGWPGMIVPDALQKEIGKELNAHNLIPVFLSEDELKGYYEGFSNEVLWPVFHYTSTYAQYDGDNWEYYVGVNQKFCDIILEHLNPGDILWIHDYQLLLLPQMIREKQPDVTIGFFQHIPFPSQELFRLIPWRKELLTGMLGADLIGFHTYDDVRHFISAASSLLSLQINSNIVRIGNRIISIDAFPMGIDSKKYAELSNKKLVKEHSCNLKKHFPNQKIILSIDRLDYSKGIIPRLEAIELFLTEHPEYIDKIVFYMVVVPSRDSVPEYQRLKDEIDRLVGDINARYRNYDWYPIAYFYQSFPIEYLSALYNCADACLITSMRDGMNLVSKEYVASRNDGKGVLILSELAGASKELIDAIIVNPTHMKEVKEAIYHALNISEERKMKKMKTMREIVFKFNIHHWVNIFMKKLKEVKNMQDSMKAKIVSPEMKNTISERYKESKKRILLLDYDGTLVGFQTQIDAASPDEELYKILRSLQQNKDNEVIIISGRKHETLEKWFNDYDIKLIAEHGAWSKTKGKWTQRAGLVNHWKNEVKNLMETFSDNTPGSFVEEKSYSLVWHYRKVQKGLGALRANELTENLRYIVASQGLHLLNGNKVIEVKNSDINKGKATYELLTQKEYDFILAIGDDETDEDIFKVLPENAISIKVGSNISAAKYFIEDHNKVRNLLRKLSSI